ncbi:MAG: hypothetical protein AAF581_11150 [Planctomycetota bacterium]
MKKKKHTGPLPSFIAVYFRDPMSSIGWEDESFDDYQHEDTACRAAGWIVKEDKEQVTICGVTGEHSCEHTNRIVIPKSSILDRHEIRFPKGRKKVR